MHQKTGDAVASCIGELFGVTLANPVWCTPSELDPAELDVLGYSQLWKVY